jgi:DNA invertase Pin-like site-specific DNA recombinase
MGVSTERMDSMIYGYARISMKCQSIDRQIRNITTAYPDAIIFQEAYTGTKVQGRKEFNKLLKRVNPGDTIVFDSVSRMSRDADEGTEMYFYLFNREINLIFLKEGYINTDVYKSVLSQSFDLIGDDLIDIFLEAINKATRLLAEKQIKKAFEQAEKEVNDLHQRTKEGLAVARLKGKQIGQKPGIKMITKKSLKAKPEIKRLNRSFDGTLNDRDTIKFLGIARNTFYKYKRELKEEM